MLTPPQIDAGGTVISLVERRASGSLMFQLTGTARANSSQRDWIEWHPSGKPGSFVGGLDDEHKLKRSTKVYNEWHLVRYEN